MVYYTKNVKLSIYEEAKNSLSVLKKEWYFISWAVHDFQETCHSVTFIVLVNSHQRWKQTQKRICFHLWSELTLALWCYSIVWSLFSWNKMTSFTEFMIEQQSQQPEHHLAASTSHITTRSISMEQAIWESQQHQQPKVDGDAIAGRGSESFDTAMPFYMF